jgi:hypothetical protein
MLLITGIILIILGIILGVLTIGSQLIDILKLDFSEVGRNILWVILAIALIGIGVICLFFAILGYIF